MILEVADTAPIQSPPMKSAGNGRIAGGMYPKRLLDDGGYSRDSSDPFGKLYEKGGGEESSRFTRQINTVLGQPSSIS